MFSTNHWIKFFCSHCISKISFLLLQICGDELIFTTKIMTFPPVSSPIEKDPFLSNPIQYPEYFY